ncbi:hypothetical protein EX30DRAFT_308477 [Ascodesmis nigricans]|uniref:Caffeine-induced death protein Cid2 n=1 Tax=Ascodesmis nigricans TaxID=341454 RepID=A0A4S2MTB3_9PEZI|nr:hypothetical protein EX30DRAFT_308477 [Ascodesmis nigricans]
MASQPASKVDHPSLTPQLCFSTSTLKDFLRVSRSQIDDTITQNLNALNTPASRKFDPTSLSKPSRTLPGRSVPLPSESCKSFVSDVLFPSWQSRSDVLNYCASVATSDDPNDPDSLIRMAESQTEREKVVDERLDPYSGRFFPRESRSEVLAAVVRNERAVEEIVRSRTWSEVRQRCDAAVRDDWREELDHWRTEKEKA